MVPPLNVTVPELNGVPEMPTANKGVPEGTDCGFPVVPLSSLPSIVMVPELCVNVAPLAVRRLPLMLILPPEISSVPKLFKLALMPLILPQVREKDCQMLCLIG
jgi:hypothetical protein